MTYAVPSQDPERLDCGSSSPQVSQPSGAQPKVGFTHREHVGIQSIRGFGRACSQGGTGDGGGLVRIDRQGLAIRDSAANYDRLTRASPPVRVQVCTHLHVEPKHAPRSYNQDQLSFGVWRPRLGAGLACNANVESTWRCGTIPNHLVALRVV